MRNPDETRSTQQAVSKATAVSQAFGPGEVESPDRRSGVSSDGVIRVAYYKNPYEMTQDYDQREVIKLRSKNVGKLRQSAKRHGE